MPLGSKEPPRRKIIYMSPRALDADKKVYPHFSVSIYENKQSIKQPDETAVSGYLVGIKHGSYIYKGDTVPTITVLLVDGDEMYKIEANSQSNMIRSLMNTVIGTRDFDVMRISLYAKKNDKGEDMPNIYISNNDEKTVWKFSHKEDLVPLIDEYEDRKTKKMMKDYAKVDELLLKHWIELEPHVEQRAKEKGYITAPAKMGAAGGAVAASSHLDTDTRSALDTLTQEELDKHDATVIKGVDDDDLPF